VRYTDYYGSARRVLCHEKSEGQFVIITFSITRVYDLDVLAFRRLGVPFEQGISVSFAWLCRAANAVVISA
jgi:hypothetical protein